MIDEVPDHNGAKWLVVRHLPSVPYGRDLRAGWYVVRVCPCHWGERVTLPFPDQDWAEAVRELLLEVRP